MMDCLICSSFVTFDKIELENAKLLQVFCELLTLDFARYDNYSFSSEFFCMICLDQLNSVSQLFAELKLIQMKIKDLQKEVQTKIHFTFRESLKLNKNLENECSQRSHKIRLHICNDLSLLPLENNISEREGKDDDNDEDESFSLLNGIEIKEEQRDEEDFMDMDESSPNSPRGQERNSQLESLKGGAMKEGSILRIKKLKDQTTREIEEASFSVNQANHRCESNESESRFRLRRVVHCLKPKEKYDERKKIRNFKTNNIKGIKVENPKEKYLITCKFCPKLFKTETIMKNHRLRSHKNQMVLCKYSKCEEEFQEFLQMRNHYRRVHLGSLRVTCPICEKVIRKIGKAAHMKSHEKRENFTCETCHKIFSTKDGYKTHCKNLHSEVKESFICHWCGKVLRSLASLTHHENQIHVKAFKFTCEICQHGTQNLADLRSHQLCHSEPSLLCPICGQTLRSKTGMKQHMLGHSGEKPHNCRTCGKAFRSTKQRDVHETTHTPHILTCACEICGKGFTHKTYLKLHVNWHKRVEARGNGPPKLRPRKPKDPILLVNEIPL